MMHQECTPAVIDFGFTERQARFIVLVLRHGGVCVPRQYANFSGIANGGRRCNGFFDRLVRRGYAHEIGCVHNRARLYHLHHKPLYHAIGEATSTYRRRVSPRLAVERLMMLDAVLPISNLEWFTTASEKAAYVASLSTATGADGQRQQRGGIASGNDPRFASTFPIGREADGRVVLAYLVTEVWPERFRRFLQDQVRLLRLAPSWTLRLVFPRPLDRVYDNYQAVIRDELESPIHAGTIHELQRYFEQRRRSAHTSAHQGIGRVSNAGPRFLQTPRFDALYSRWLRQGDAVFERPSSRIIAEALGDGRGRVESVVLPHSYRHLSPLVDQPVSLAGDLTSEAPRRSRCHSRKASKNEALRNQEWEASPLCLRRVSIGSKACLARIGLGARRQAERNQPRCRSSHS
ncbi:MAG: hypothetical protein GEU99_11925 [Luteitalea sp.]|nr:hypothetical protein [Luteitalea sp.]